MKTNIRGGLYFGKSLSAPPSFFLGVSSKIKGWGNTVITRGKLKIKKVVCDIGEKKYCNEMYASVVLSQSHKSLELFIRGF